MQWACYEYLRWLEPCVKEAGGEFVRIWRYLGISDHLYYMFTAGGAPGEVHSYFSHFETPYDAFVAFFSIIHDFDTRLREYIKKADHPFIFQNGKEIWSLKGLYEYVRNIPDEELVKYVERGDFERWIEKSIGEEDIAREVGNLRSERREEYDVNRLREKILEILSKIVTMNRIK